MEIQKNDVIIVYETMHHSYVCTLDSVSEAISESIQESTYLFKLDSNVESADWLCLLYMDCC